MLVLSRRTHERIVLPTIETAIQVVTIKPGVVRLGIAAPDHLPVYRQEVLDKEGFVDHEQASRPTPSGNLSALDELLHYLGNRLNTTTIGLALLRRQLQAQRPELALATLERIEHDLKALQEEATQTASRPSLVEGGERRRALLVEDNHNERELLASFLRMGGMEVTTAGDGADALDYLRTANDRPDVILLDMILPRCDGPTMVRALREDPSFAGVKIFGVTGSDPSRFNLTQGPEGINRWYHKPLDPEILLHELQQDLVVEA
jgi:carbon storage regulator CsrA